MTRAGFSGTANGLPARAGTGSRCGATDGDGITQSGEPVDPAPNGAEGWHTITVTVDA